MIIIHCLVIKNNVKRFIDPIAESILCRTHCKISIPSLQCSLWLHCSVEIQTKQHFSWKPMLCVETVLLHTMRGGVPLVVPTNLSNMEVDKTIRSLLSWNLICWTDPSWLVSIYLLFQIAAVFPFRSPIRGFLKASWFKPNNTPANCQERKRRGPASENWSNWAALGTAFVFPLYSIISGAEVGGLGENSHWFSARLHHIQKPSDSLLSSFEWALVSATQGF